MPEVSRQDWLLSLSSNPTWDPVVHSGPIWDILVPKWPLVLSVPPTHLEGEGDRGQGRVFVFFFLPI